MREWVRRLRLFQLMSVFFVVAQALAAQEARNAIHIAVDIAQQ